MKKGRAKEGVEGTSTMKEWVEDMQKEEDERRHKGQGKGVAYCRETSTQGIDKGAQCTCGPAYN